ncbi:hypothetical protein WMF18_17200 [Sorangium sp. So ce315]|uniref:hypothetical protein n=1 Tax=Sorangium sp. So ce315 TaxID=3133299 RepID=UPI003F5F1EF8
MTPELAAAPCSGPPVATLAELRARLGAIAGELRALQGAVIAGTMTGEAADAHRRLLDAEAVTIGVALEACPRAERLADQLLRALEA